MSNLDSVFDLQAGFPPNGKSGLEVNYPQKTAESPELVEGDIVKIEAQAHLPVFTKLTSARIQGATLEMELPDEPFVIIEGMDMYDAEAADVVTAVKLKTGIIFKVAAPVVFAVGDLVRANAGKLAALTAGKDNIGGGVQALRAQQPIGQVLEYNATGAYAIVSA
jgi:hypothetical protein